MHKRFDSRPAPALLAIGFALGLGAAVLAVSSCVGTASARHHRDSRQHGRGGRRGERPGPGSGGSSGHGGTSGSAGTTGARHRRGWRDWHGRQRPAPPASDAASRGATGATAARRATTGAAGRRGGTRRHHRQRRRDAAARGAAAPPAPRARRGDRRGGTRRRHRHRGRHRRRPAPYRRGRGAPARRRSTRIRSAARFAWGRQNPSGTGSLSSYNYLQMVAYWVESGVRARRNLHDVRRLQLAVEPRGRLEPDPGLLHVLHRLPRPRERPAGRQREPDRTEPHDRRRGS